MIKKISNDRSLSFEYRSNLIEQLSSAFFDYNLDIINTQEEAITLLQRLRKAHHEKINLLESQNTFLNMSVSSLVSILKEKTDQNEAEKK